MVIVVVVVVGWWLLWCGVVDGVVVVTGVIMCYMWYAGGNV